MLVQNLNCSYKKKDMILFKNFFLLRKKFFPKDIDRIFWANLKNWPNVWKNKDQIFSISLRIICNHWIKMVLRSECIGICSGGCRRRRRIIWLVAFHSKSVTLILFVQTGFSILYTQTLSVQTNTKQKKIIWYFSAFFMHFFFIVFVHSVLRIIILFATFVWMYKYIRRMIIDCLSFW